MSEEQVKQVAEKEVFIKCPLEMSPEQAQVIFTMGLRSLVHAHSGGALVTFGVKDGATSMGFTGADASALVQYAQFVQSLRTQDEARVKDLEEGGNKILKEIYEGAGGNAAEGGAGTECKCKETGSGCACGGKCHDQEGSNHQG